MFGTAYLSSVLGMIGAIVYVGVSGAAPVVQPPTGGIGLILLMILQ